MTTSMPIWKVRSNMTPLFKNFIVQYPPPPSEFPVSSIGGGGGPYGYFLELHNGKNCKLYYKLTKTFNISLVSGSTSIMSCSIADTCFKNEVYFLNFYRKFDNHTKIKCFTDTQTVPQERNCLCVLSLLLEA